MVPVGINQGDGPDQRLNARTRTFHGAITMWGCDFVSRFGPLKPGSSPQAAGPFRAGDIFAWLGRSFPDTSLGGQAWVPSPYANPRGKNHRACGSAPTFSRRNNDESCSLDFSKYNPESLLENPCQGNLASSAGPPQTNCPVPYNKNGVPSKKKQ